MLKIFNDLKPFFEDNYKRLGVREYARLRKISPPSASKLLAEMRKEGLLKMEKDRNYLLFSANRENKLFINLSRSFWQAHFEKIGLIKLLEETFVTPLIVLFGSFSKAEINKESDIDIAVFTPTKKQLNLKRLEKILKRKIHLFVFKNISKVPSNLRANILNELATKGKL